LQPALQRASGRRASCLAASARRDERPAARSRRPLRCGAGRPPARPPRGARARAPRLSPLCRPHAATRRARRVPRRARDPDRAPLPGADPPAAGRRALQPAGVAAHRAARPGDPDAADVGEPHRRGDRHRRRGGAEVLRSLMAEPLRVLQLYPKEDYFTGAAIQLRELVLGLKARGHEVAVATRPSEIWVEKMRAASVPHFPLPMASEVDLRSVKALVRQGVPAEKIEVIYSGTDTDRFHPDVDGGAVRRELGLGPEHFLVTQIGIRSWKGNDDVLEAMAAVADRLPHARLLFVGANEAKAKILYDKAAARKIRARVSVFLFREDIPQILKASDVTVDASYAGLGLTGTLRESLAVGTPVIGTDLEGNPELVLHRQTGLLVNPRDPAGLAEA